MSQLKTMTITNFIIIMLMSNAAMVMLQLVIGHCEIISKGRPFQMSAYDTAQAHRIS